MTDDLNIVAGQKIALYGHRQVSDRGPQVRLKAGTTEKLCVLCASAARTSIGIAA